MTELMLISMKLQNFKGIKEFLFIPDGKDAVVAGGNGTGKSTLADAYNWLFLGKDSNGKADFQIKPTDKKNGQEIHHLETEVTLEILVDGKEMSLSKRYYEKWTQKKGTATESFSGHTTDHFVNDVPKKEKEFLAIVEQIVDKKTFSLVTDPAAFDALPWSTRRDVLLSMVGDISDADVIASAPKLKALAAILGDCSIDDHKAKVKSQQKAINKELVSIPIRISELQNQLVSIEAPNQEDKDLLESQLTDETEKLRSLQSNERLSEKQIRLNEVKNKILIEKNMSMEAMVEGRKPIHKKINILASEKSDLSQKIANLQGQIQANQKRNQIVFDAMAAMRKNYATENAKKANPVAVCPTCQQNFPEEMIEEVVAKFNRDKSVRMEDIQKEGVSSKLAYEAREKDIKTAQTKIDTAQKRSKAIDALIAEKDLEVAAIEQIVNTKDLDKEAAILESEISAIQNGSKTKENTANGHISDIKVKIADWDKLQAAWDAAKKSRARIDELGTQEKTLAGEYEKLSAQVFLCEQFVVTKVELLEDRINSKFKMATFKMFKTQINGGIDECCEILFNGVPYSRGLNTAARINVGLDIIRTLSQHYGFTAPVFIDGAESVNDLIQINAQVISLAVSHDKALLVERHTLAAA